MEGKLYYDEKAGRYSFRYQDSDGELQDYGGIHCGEGFEVLLNDVWVPTRMEREGFKEKDDGVEVLLKDNPSLQADMVVLAIGVTPDTVLAKEAGLELGIKESIVVNLPLGAINPIVAP